MPSCARMITLDLSLVREFERRLDSALKALPSMRKGGEDALFLSANVIEECYAQKSYGIAAHLESGLKVLAPYFVGNRKSEVPDVKQLVQDLNFAGHYYWLRDYLYYTYNAPGSFMWTSTESGLKIRFRDKSIPRQYYLQANNNFLISLERFADDSQKDEILVQLRRQRPAPGQPINDDIMMIIEKEINIKLGTYFNFLSGEPVSLGEYSFTEFDTVFRVLLVYALFHRYLGTARDLHGAVQFNRSELLHNLTAATELPRWTCERILRDIA